MRLSVKAFAKQANSDLIKELDEILDLCAKREDLSQEQCDSLDDRIYDNKLQARVKAELSAKLKELGLKRKIRDFCTEFSDPDVNEPKDWKKLLTDDAFLKAQYYDFLDSQE
jgi:hypothetical protein